jgi:thiamine pyrophosphate-dependent acetolactate synthase large subunit-like protein
MGYALNAGIASILASPAPAGAVVLAGDGGFQMTLNVSLDNDLIPCLKGMQR